MRGHLKNLFTLQTHVGILQSEPCNVKAAQRYSALVDVTGVTVTRQNVKYWRKLYASDTSPAKANSELKTARKLKSPDPLGKGGKFRFNNIYRSIVVMPDLHAPYHHRHALAFMAAVKAKFKPDLVVNLGDEADKHAMSFHDSDPNLKSAGDELEATKPVIAELHKLFPRMLLCDSNHGSMHYRKAKAHGMPVQYLKSYREILLPGINSKGWQWAENWRVRTPMGEVLFKHQASGAILIDASHNQCNLVVGHHHGKFTIEYGASSARLYWGAFFGCLIDKDSLAFAYGKHTMYKPILGCGVIINGIPTLIPMLLDADGDWVGHLGEE